LEGPFKDKVGWVLVEEVRPRPAITELLDDPNDKSPSVLARAILKRDKAIYKDLILMEMKAQAKAKKLPRTQGQREL
jgi:hypothetical protein